MALDRLSFAAGVVFCLVLACGPCPAQPSGICEPEEGPVDTFVGPRIRSVLAPGRQVEASPADTRSRAVPPPRMPSRDVDPRAVPEVPASARENLLSMEARRAEGRDGVRQPVDRVDTTDPLVARLFPPLAQAAYVGDGECLRCHAVKKEDWRRSIYGRIHYDRSLPAERQGCEGCHGPGSEHADRGAVEWIANPAKLDRRPLVQVCFSCHAGERLVRRQGWQFSEHAAALVTCLDCHRVHRPKAAKALVDEPNRLCLSCHRDQEACFSMTSRHPLKTERVDAVRSMREGKIRCIDCHRVHAAANPRILKSERSEACLKCHQEFRGPFVFQHGSFDVLADGCMTCHTPHGSPNRSLLRRPDRSLCLTCHTDSSGHGVGTTCFSAAGCHNEIHGSNKNRYLVGSMGLAPADVGRFGAAILE